MTHVCIHVRACKYVYTHVTYNLSNPLVLSPIMLPHHLLQLSNSWRLQPLHKFINFGWCKCLVNLRHYITYPNGNFHQKSHTYTLCVSQSLNKVNMHYVHGWNLECSNKFYIYREQRSLESNGSKVILLETRRPCVCVCMPVFVIFRFADRTSWSTWLHFQVLAHALKVKQYLCILQGFCLNFFFHRLVGRHQLCQLQGMNNE